MLQSDQLPSPDAEVEVRAARAPQYGAIVSLRGEHDLATTPTLRDALSPVIGDVRVDLSDCTIVDSTVIGALIAASQELQLGAMRWRSSCRPRT